jgi:hypothetical protein
MGVALPLHTENRPSNCDDAATKIAASRKIPLNRNNAASSGLGMAGPGGGWVVFTQATSADTGAAA